MAIDLDAVVLGKLESDSDFQAGLADLSEQDKTAAIEAKKSELTKLEFESLDTKVRENEQKFRDQQTRAEKAEQELKKNKPAGGVAPKNDETFSSKEYSYLYSKVHEDDVEKVEKAMRALEIKDPKVALKDPVVVAILEKEENYRKTALATNSRTSRPGVKQVSGESIIEKMNKEGEIPEPGSKEAEAVFWAKRGKKQ